MDEFETWIKKWKFACFIRWTQLRWPDLYSLLFWRTDAERRLFSNRTTYLWVGIKQYAFYFSWKMLDLTPKIHSCWLWFGHILHNCLLFVGLAKEVSNRKRQYWSNKRHLNVFSNLFPPTFEHFCLFRMWFIRSECIQMYRQRWAHNFI